MSSNKVKLADICELDLGCGYDGGRIPQKLKEGQSRIVGIDKDPSKNNIDTLMAEVGIRMRDTYFRGEASKNKKFQHLSVYSYPNQFYGKALNKAFNHLKRELKKHYGRIDNLDTKNMIDQAIQAIGSQEVQRDMRLDARRVNVSQETRKRVIGAGALDFLSELESKQLSYIYADYFFSNIFQDLRQILSLCLEKIKPNGKIEVVEKLDEFDVLIPEFEREGFKLEGEPEKISDEVIKKLSKRTQAFLMMREQDRDRHGFKGIFTPKEKS